MNATAYPWLLNGYYMGDFPTARRTFLVLFYVVWGFVTETFPLFQVRASNLQDLVYKNGQAGITKASVSITFDNSDKKQSPLGFEVHDEITVTRQVSGY